MTKRDALKHFRAENALLQSRLDTHRRETTRILDALQAELRGHAMHLAASPMFAAGVRAQMHAFESAADRVRLARYVIAGI